MMQSLVLGTRGSALALAQAELTRASLTRAFPDLQVEKQVFVTRGDQKLDLSLIQATEAGGKGLFTKELEEALLDGRIDVAVHSLKDLPGHNPEGLEVLAVLERAPTADVLISKTPGGLDGLPLGARVGSSSVRRARQIQWLRPDLVIEEYRGNVPTRIRKLAQSDTFAATVLAQAGLERLGFGFSSGILDFEDLHLHATSLAAHLLPAIGQGAIALQARADRPEVSAVLSAINHQPTFVAICAERAVQRILAGDCTLPVGVRSTLEGKTLRMQAILFGRPGVAPKQAEAEGASSEPERVAEALCRGLL